MTFCWAIPIFSLTSLQSSYLRDSSSEDSSFLLSESFFSSPHLFSLCNFDIRTKDEMGKFVPSATWFPHLKPSPLHTPSYREPYPEPCHHLRESHLKSQHKSPPSPTIPLSNSLQPFNLTIPLSNPVLTIPILLLSWWPHCYNCPIQSPPSPLQPSSSLMV